MRKIEAIIRVERLEDVMNALEKLGYPGMTVTRVEGHGRQKGLKEQFRGREFKVDLLPKVKVEIVVRKDDATRIVSAIALAAKTGEIGDGKIFVSPVEDAVRIRTGEAGAAAV